jgi:predicted RNA-binding Zn-ribbon protein involved in translation (DUF1610 family)
MPRVNIQIRFKKVVWLCPVCGTEDIEEMNIAGGNSYEHDCSNCQAHFNQSGPNMRTYEGCLNYTPDDIPITEVEKLHRDEELDKTVAEKLALDKQTWVDKQHYDFKNPVPYVEPSKEDLKNIYESKLAEANQQLALLAEKATPEELTAIKQSMESKVVELQTKIEEVSVKPIEEIIPEVIK